MPQSCAHAWNWETQVKDSKLFPAFQKLQETIPSDSGILHISTETLLECLHFLLAVLHTAI